MNGSDPATITELKDHLTARLAPSALAALNGRIALSWPLPEQPREGCLAFEVNPDQLRWLGSGDPVDVTFYFARRALVSAVLCGGVDPIKVFLRGEFCSSGYLLWTFPLLQLFRQPAPDATARS